MAILVQNPTVFKYTATGSTVFQVSHQFFDNTDLKVFKTAPGVDPNPLADIQTLYTDYTVTGAGTPSGGSITFLAAPASGSLIIIWVDIPDTRTYDFVGANFDPDEINRQLDKLTILIQQVNDTLKYRGVLYSINDDLVTGDLVLPALDANQLWKKNSGGNLVAAEFEVDPGANTLRSELISKTMVAPGTDNIGVWNPKKLIGETLTDWINDESNLLPFPDDEPLIKNVSDPTKLLTIDISNVPSGRSSTMYVGNNDTDLLWNPTVLYRDLSGLQCSSAADTDHDITVSIGHISKYNPNVNFPIILRTPRTKQADVTWATGTNDGGMASGVTLSPSSTYYIFVIGVEDKRGFPGGAIEGEVGFDTSLTAANLLSDAVVIAAGYNIYRRVGAFFTDGSGNIRPFDQYKDYFQYRAPVLSADPTSATITTTATNYTIDVPSGIILKANVNIGFSTPGTQGNIYFYSPSQADQSSYGFPAITNKVPSQANTSSGGSYDDYAYFSDQIETNTSAQIRGIGSFGSGSSHSLMIHVMGYYDLFINE